MAIILNRELVFNEVNELKQEALLFCLKTHKGKLERFEKLKRYYDGEHDILNRKKKTANNKVMINHAEYITDFATSYFIGNPITYNTDDETLIKAFKKTNIDMVDQELSRDISIFGIGYELVYQDELGNTKSTNLSPINSFLVVDDSVEYKSLFGVHYYDVYGLDNKLKHTLVNVYTDAKHLTFELTKEKLTQINEEENIFGKVPLIEYWNKANQKGDFESVMHLIDAYNILQSDRVNDKEKFVDALLVIYGSLLGDDLEEKTKTARALKELGILEMPVDTRAEYVAKTFNEQEIEVLKNSIVDDIHKIAKVPNLTDKNFAGNSSGVAMAYKLLGLEQLAQTKEGYYRMGLQERLRLYAAIEHIRMKDIDVDAIDISFKRSLPANLLEISQLIGNLKGTVSDETLLAQIPFVENVQSELEKVKEQKQTNIETNQDMFGSYKHDVEHE